MKKNRNQERPSGDYWVLTQHQLKTKLAQVP